MADDAIRRSLERAGELLRAAERALCEADSDAGARAALARTGRTHGQTGVEWVGRTAALLAEAAAAVEHELASRTGGA